MTYAKTALRLRMLAKRFRAMQATILCQNKNGLDSVLWVRLEMKARESEALAREAERRSLRALRHRDLTQPIKLVWDGGRWVMSR